MIESSTQDKLPAILQNDINDILIGMDGFITIPELGNFSLDFSYTEDPQVSSY